MKAMSHPENDNNNSETQDINEAINRIAETTEQLLNVMNNKSITDSSSQIPPCPGIEDTLQQDKEFESEFRSARDEHERIRQSIAQKRRKRY